MVPVREHIKNRLVVVDASAFLVVAESLDVETSIKVFKISLVNSFPRTTQHMHINGASQ